METVGASDDVWKCILDHYHKTGEWNSQNGPQPGQPGCRVPSHLLNGYAPSPPSVPEPNEEPPPEVVLGVPFIMTRDMKDGLSRLGFTTEQISGMTPGQAHEILTRELCDEPQQPGKTGSSDQAPQPDLPTPLEPDRDQIEIFTDALFRHAKSGFVSLRAFYENEDKPFHIAAVQIGSTSETRAFLNKRAVEVARMCARADARVVFCPIIATFKDRKGAKQVDIVEGLALSVECDKFAQEARARLEKILGTATVVVRSGGTWTDPATGEVQDKLHLHWRLKNPATTEETLAALKRARDIASTLVGADPSNKPVCHPIRWPGSWHRKREPVLCRIESISSDAEIELATALGELSIAYPEQSKPDRADGQADGTDWAALIAGILSGDSYHEPLTRFAAKLLVAGMSDGAAVNLLRGLMEASAGPRDDRWRARYDDIPRAVSTAREKFGQTDETTASTAGEWRENPEPESRAKPETWAEPDLSVLRLHRRPAVPLPIEVFGDWWAR